MNSYHKKNKGFTLAEAMAAMVILFVAAAAVTLPFTSSASVRQETARRTLASKLAADRLEEIAAADYGSIIATYDGYTEPAGQVENAVGEIFADPMYQNFSRLVTCTNATVAGIDLTWVSVTVYYKGTETITLSTLLGPG
jgi:Tfp pilus assembly protein PilV